MNLNDKQKRLSKSFLIGFIAATIIVACFVVPANFAGLHFVMGFPLFLVSAEPIQSGTLVTVSWLIPVIVGLVFSLIDGLRMV